MGVSSAGPITVTTSVDADAATAWRAFTDPEHITEWNFASPKWHCPRASNDLVAGGKFAYEMAARDGSAAFELTGTFDEVDAPFDLQYTLDDGRQVSVSFEPDPSGSILVTQTFDLEDGNPEELQRQGWQAILDNYAAYVGEL